MCIRKTELKAALDSLVSKGYYYSDLVTGKLIHTVTRKDGEADSGLKDITSLSQREIDFMKWACSELTYREIADKMCLSVHTIDGYRDALFEKLGIKSRTGIVMFAVKNGIVDISLKPESP